MLVHTLYYNLVTAVFVHVCAQNTPGRYLASAGTPVMFIMFRGPADEGANRQYIF